MNTDDLEYIEGEIFDGEDFTSGLKKAEYDECTFINCQLANTDLSGMIFSQCTFRNCDMSMISVNKTSFKDVFFQSCKLMGVRFDYCHKILLAFTFEECLLDFSSFYQLTLRDMLFKNCQLVEVEFIEADLSGTTFDGCDLTRAVFERTNLRKTDLRLADHFSIDPENNMVEGARFSLQGLPGLLEKYGILIG